MIARFEGFELKVSSAELRDPAGKVTRLSEQSFRILVALLETPGEVVSREELCKRLWPNGTIVEFEHSISVAVNRLRQALGDAADNPKFIETLARRGYRWKTAVEWEEAKKGVSSPPPAVGGLMGKRIGHYRVLEILGGGGMGLVYKAEDIKLGRRVALKFLPEEMAGDERAVQRFETEARAASALNHPNICTIYAVEEHEGQPFIAMELLEGRTLRDMIAEASSGNKPLLLNVVLDVAMQIAKGLEAAHGSGIVHRDIKPANIFVTADGHAKILDFGLAKRHDVELREPEPAAISPTGEWNPSLTLTRTGVAVGTAAYMSPEQVRGEQLDARTDLFSFGLVLYEMAAGKRAFDGETAVVLHNAILRESPPPARNLNPEMPSKLERIIQKAIEKDRQERYQTSSEILEELESLRGARTWTSRRIWATVGALGLIVVLAASALLWQMEQKTRRGAAPDLKIRELTSNSVENLVLDGRISPDGKYLAYVDYKGVRIKRIDNGDVVDLPWPEALKGRNVQFAFGGWAPDSSRLIANAHPANDIEYLDEFEEDADLSVWEFSLGGGAPRLLRDRAWADAFSPDGAFVSFRTGKDRNSSREIWVMDRNGNNARKLFDADAVGGLYWSPEGRTVSYLRDTGSEKKELDFKGYSYPWDGDHIRPGATPRENTAPFGMDNTFDVTELPDKRFIFSVRDAGSSGDVSCNFWTARRDPETGTVIGKPEQLTHWNGFCMSDVSVTKDARRLTFLHWSGHPSLDVADVKASGRKITNERHFTESEGTEVWLDWTRDSKSLFFLSERNGHPAIYRKRVDEAATETLVASPNGNPNAIRVSADGKWFIYLSRNPSEDPSRPLQMMRVAVEGGTPEAIFGAGNVEWWGCSRNPTAACVLLERAGEGSAVLTFFDPIKGRGAEMFRLPFELKFKNWTCALSLKGNRLAIIRGPRRPIEIMSLKGKVLSEIKISQWDYAGPMEWASDDAGLFVPTLTKRGSELLHVSLQGNVDVIRQNPGGNYCPGLPSPDGKRIALVKTGLSRNMWLMEGF